MLFSFKKYHFRTLKMKIFTFRKSLLIFIIITFILPPCDVTNNKEEGIMREWQKTPWQETP